MHSNGGRGFIAEARSPAVDESRRSGKPAALARLRSYGGTYPTAGANGETSRIVLAMNLFRAWLFVCDDRVLSPGLRSTRANQATAASSRKTSSTLECVVP